MLEEAVRLTMAELSDTIRPDLEHLSALGRPDARLHLPKHYAIVSWTTPEGRQSAFVAQTIPLRLDRKRLACHAARQYERGGRHLTDLRQPHWARNQAAHGTLEGEAQRLGSTAPTSPNLSARPVPATLSDSYRELIELDGAHSVRWATRVESPCALEPDLLDLEILALVAGLRHVLSSQIHRRFNPQRAATTTQRRLKRLSDAGLLQRFQFHRRDGGGIPMCYVITPAGLSLLHVSDLLKELGDGDVETLHRAATASPAAQERRLRQARDDVHAAGWALALERALNGAALRLRGPVESVLSPPMRSSAAGRAAIGPADLLLPGGRVPHEFLRTDASGERVEVESFETVRPALTIEIPAGAGNGDDSPGSGGIDNRGGILMRPVAESLDVMAELDDRLPRGRAAAKLERYDHLIAGWSEHINRYGRRRQALTMVVFVCRDRSRAREFAKRADAVLVACRAYAGEYPFDWDYPGRERILFVSERDAHEGYLSAYGVPRLPPAVRVTVAHGDPRAGRAIAESRELLRLASRAGE